MNIREIKKAKTIDFNKIKARKDKYEASFMCIPKTDPWVPITLGDKEYKLEYSYYATTLVQREFNKNIFAGEIKDTDFTDMPFLCRMLELGLVTHHPEIEKEQDFVSRLITLRHRLYYVACVSKALEVIQPEFDDIADMLDELELLQPDEEMEAGDTTAPLPEIVPSPISGEAAE